MQLEYTLRLAALSLDTARETIWEMKLNELTHFQVLDQIPLRSQEVSYYTVANFLRIPELVLRSVARVALTARSVCEP